MTAVMLNSNANLRNKIWLLLILLWATWLRFNGLNEPGFWLDELAYTVAAQNPIIDQITNPAEALNVYLSSDPTLSAIPFSLALKLGFANYIARFPAALFGILSIAIFYRLGKTLFGNSVGLLAALLLATSNYHVFFSQEARNYAQFIFFSLGSFWLLYRAINHGQRINWLFYLFFTFGGVSTNHLMAFNIAVQGVAIAALFGRALYQRGPGAPIVTKWLKTGGWFALSVLTVYLLRLPWLSDFTQRTCTGCEIGSPTYTLDLARSFASFMHSYRAFTSGNAIFTAFFTILIILGIGWGISKMPKAGIFTLCWLVLSIPVTTAGLWYISQFFSPRYTIWGLPAFLLMTALGLVAAGKLLSSLMSKWKWPVPVAAVQFTVIAMLITPLILNSLQETQTHIAAKQHRPLGQMQEATEYISANADTDDIIIGIPNAQHPQFYLQHSRPDLNYLDMSSAAIPPTMKGRWYIFYGLLNIPPQWQHQIDFQTFHDLLVVYNPQACEIAQCLAEANTLFTDLAQANPDTDIEKRLNIMLNGMKQVPVN